MLDNNAKDNLNISQKDKEADKGRATCKIEEEKVNKMIETELDNQNRYNSLKKENVRSKVNKKLKELKDSGLISENLYKDLKPHTPKTPSARPLLKIHKNPLKIRLVINTQNSAVYKIGKLLSKELRQITTSGKSFNTDSKRFEENIKDEKLSDDEQIVSFDIKDMYPSLPKYDVLSEIKNRINDNKFVTSIDKCALIELAILTLEFMSFTIDQKYYNQKQGFFIGAPTSPCFTKIYIQRVSEKHFSTMLNAPRLWYRKVDDTFAITSHDLGETLQKLTDTDENIEFTMEKASEENLRFLDCIISLNEQREIITKVYRKPTQTGQYTHFSSNQPLHVKLSTIKTLVRRAKFICSDQTKNYHILEKPCN